MNDELTGFSASELAALVRARRASPVEIVEAHLRRIDEINPQLNAIITLAPDAMERACEAERLIMRGADVGLLHGVPVTIKDTIATRNLRTTCGSPMRASFIPETDAPAVARLKKAGAIILGKTNVPEMAVSYETDNPVFGRTNNPFDSGRTPGGSSGGEAAAIASCMSAAGLGSDLVGSIRIPAHFCGICGLKPTIGCVPCAGHTPPAIGVLSLGAVVGPMARKTLDLALLFDVIAGFNDTESLSVPIANESRENRFDEIDLLRGLRSAWYADEGIAPVSIETRCAVELSARYLTEAGLKMREETPPGVARSAQLWTHIFARAAAAFIREEYKGCEEKAGALVRHIIADYDQRPPALDDFISSWRERDSLRAALIEWMKDTPLIIAPVGSSAAFAHGARMIEIEGRAKSLFRAMMR